ncbi:MAG: DUF2478 domain-containing protein [Hyphomicrobiales bacterium]|nr:DUF2478 domain-containing protein [Hyphomicrobiales bacterium]MCP5370265.1 DUF2478 domain-containing protein [Hyphomicrobiales bacterium]
MQPGQGVRAGIVVGEDGVDSEELLAAFAGELRRRGVAVGGVFQRTGRAGGRRVMELVDLMTDEVIPISQDLGRGSDSCILDPEGLSRGSLAIRRARDAGAALVVVSKFSNQEAVGRGLAEEMFVTLAEGTPVLTTVAPKHLESWGDLSGGLGTLLRPRLADLRAWWAAVESGAGGAAD